jgi:probable rRNA maturation factor
VAEIVVDVVDRQRLLRIDAAWLERVVRRALAREGIAGAEICLLLVRDRQMATLHEEWLGIPGPTDVITFDLATGPRRHGLHGDIAVSTETALRAARELGWPPRCEVAYYVVHGLLHLAGYDDHAPTVRQAMRRRERVLMTAAGLPRPPRRPVARGVS